MITRKNVWWWLGGGVALVWLFSRMGGKEATTPAAPKGKPGELEITIFGPKEARTGIEKILLSAPSNCPGMPRLSKLLRTEGLVYVFEALFADDVTGKLAEPVTVCIFEHVKTFSPDVTKIVARRVS